MNRTLLESLEMWFFTHLGLSFYNDFKIHINFHNIPFGAFEIDPHFYFRWVPEVDPNCANI